MATLKLTAAAVLAAFAFAMWYAFIRRVPEESAEGTITDKLYKPAGTYSLQHPGVDRGFRMPTSIPIAEAYVFAVRLDGAGEQVAAALNTIESRQFKVGQRVRVQFQRRGLPLLWQRITVNSMSPAGAP